MSFEVVIKARPQWRLFDWRELWRFRELLYIFGWRDIKVRYKQTAIGILWVVLQPVVNTVIFTIFFGNFAHIPSGPLPYPIFVLLGLLFWGFFSAALSREANSFIENEQLVKKVYFPREILPISAIGAVLVDFLVTLGLFILMLLIYKVPVPWLFIPYFIVGILITITTCIGLGLLLAAINIKYRDVRYVIPFFLQTLIFVTPVIYPTSLVRPSFQLLLSLNPMTGVIDSLRSILGTNSNPHPEYLLISAFSSIILLLIGFMYFRRTERYFADIL